MGNIKMVSMVLTAIVLAHVALPASGQRVATVADPNPFQSSTGGGFFTIDSYGFSSADIASKSAAMLDIVNNTKVSLNQLGISILSTPSPGVENWLASGLFFDVAKSMCSWVIWVFDGSGLQGGKAEAGANNVGFIDLHWCDSSSVVMALVAHEGQHTLTSNKWNDSSGYDSPRTAREACNVAWMMQEVLSIKLEKLYVESMRRYGLGYLGDDEYCDALCRVSSASASYIDESGRIENRINSLIADPSTTPEDEMILCDELLDLQAARAGLRDLFARIQACGDAVDCWR